MAERIVLALAERTLVDDLNGMLPAAVIAIYGVAMILLTLLPGGYFAVDIYRNIDNRH